jgi:hypothetical protein
MGGARVLPREQFADAAGEGGSDDVFLCDYEYVEDAKRFRKRRGADGGAGAGGVLAWGGRTPAGVRAAGRLGCTRGLAQGFEAAAAAIQPDPCARVCACVCQLPQPCA